MMCAEAVAWRCHRSAIGDALVARSLGWIEHFRSERRIFDDLHQQIETAIRNRAITRRK